MSLLRELRTPEAARLSGLVHGLGQFEREGVAGFRARFGLVVEGTTGQNLGSGLTLEDAIVAGQTVLFSLDAATYPALATKIGAWILLDLVRVAALRPGETYLQIMPAGGDAVRKRLWIARPRRVGATGTAFNPPEPDRAPISKPAWVWPDHTERGDADAIRIDTNHVSQVANDGT